VAALVNPSDTVTGTHHPLSAPRRPAPPPARAGTATATRAIRH